MLRTFLRVNAKGAYQKLLREGRTFELMLRQLEESQWCSKEELERIQDEKLERLVRLAYEHVPYYRRVFDERKLKPRDIRTRADLPKLPLLTKNTVKENFELLIARNARRMLLHKGYTSGTTGTPAKFYRDLHSINFENASIWRHWHWGGFTRSDRRVTLRGDKVAPVTRTSPPFWSENVFDRQLLMSSFHLSPRNMPAYVEKIRSYRPRMLQAYPSTVYVLAMYIEEMDGHLEIPLVYTGSEPLFGVERELIEKRLKSKVFDFYGLAERVIFASECDHHEGLHLNPEYGITEIVDEDGNILERGPGRLVGTTLNNFAMPLIRYLTDDVSEKLSGACACKRNFDRIKPIETKCEDMVVTPDGRFVSPSLITFCFKPFFNIKKSQVIQDAPDHITVKIVKGERYSNEDGSALTARLKDAISKDMKIELQFVDDITRTDRGKFRWVISEVAKKRIQRF